MFVSVALLGSHQLSVNTGYLHPYSGNLNAQDYINILDETLLPFVKSKLKGAKFQLQQDCARCHSAKKTTNYLEENEIPCIPSRLATKFSRSKPHREPLGHYPGLSG